MFSKADQDQLQMALSKLHDWSNTWLLSMNVQEYKVVSYRIVNMWNNLPDYVVMSDTINTFKNRLDAHWKHRDFLFRYRATYTGTGY